MKKLLLSTLAIAACLGANATDFYLIGADVNGQSWALGTNKMTYDDSSETYSWEGEVLGTGFKINDGTWENGDYNIGCPENGGSLTLGEPFTVVANSDSGDITFKDFNKITNAKVIFDYNNLTVTVTGEGVTVDPDAIVELYVIGDNVDGKNWALQTNQMTYDESSKTYSWEGEVLGSGFKINDGTWGATYNMGADSDEDLLTVGTAFKYVARSDSKNINFSNDVVEVANPKVVVDLNAQTILVTGETGTGAIRTISDALNGEEVIYNLQGVRVNRNNMPAGIYIINGKKVAVK